MGGLPYHPSPTTTTFSFHPTDTSFKVSAHGGRGCRVVPGAVAGQDPVEREVEEPLHRAGLLLPGVPAGVPEGNEAAAAGGPGEVVSGKQKLFPVEQHGMAARVTGRRNREEIVVQAHVLRTGDLPLDAPRGVRDVPLVEDPQTSEMPREGLVVRDVV